VGASIINHHDRVFSREEHRVAPARVLIVSRTLGRGHRDHETLHLVTILKLVPDEVPMVWVGLLEESLEVISRRRRLTLVAVGDSHDTPHARVSQGIFPI
jgi:hypothetical protein